MTDLPICTEQAIQAFIGTDQTGLAGALSEYILSYASRVLNYAQAESLIVSTPAYDPEGSSLKVSALCALRHLQMARLRK